MLRSILKYITIIEWISLCNGSVVIQDHHIIVHVGEVETFAKPIILFENLIFQDSKG